MVIKKTPVFLLSKTSSPFYVFTFRQQLPFDEFFENARPNWPNCSAIFLARLHDAEAIFALSGRRGYLCAVRTHPKSASLGLNFDITVHLRERQAMLEKVPYTIHGSAQLFIASSPIPTPIYLMKFLVNFTLLPKEYE